MPLPGYVEGEAVSAAVCLPAKFILLPPVAVLNLRMNLLCPYIYLMILNGFYSFITRF